MCKLIKFTFILFSVFLLFFFFSCPEPEPDINNIGTVLGVVYDDSTQAPVIEAEVTALLNEVTDTTDTLGLFQLDSLSLGIDTFMVSAVGYDTGYNVLNIIGGMQEETFFLKLKDIIGCIPVEDTNRVYFSPYSGDTMWIYPKAIYARFHPSVTDTEQIIPVLEKYPLRVFRGFSWIDRQYEAVLCITDNSRPECHFTPYGKEGFNNFGAESIVEYSFGIFQWGYLFPSGNLIFRFKDGTSQTEIDSLFNANGLRFLGTSPHHSGGKLYHTVITPDAEKNVLDLGDELKLVPFVEYLDVSLAVCSRIPIQCP